MNSKLTRPKQGLMAGVACAIFLFSASAFALPNVTLPGGNTNAVGGSDGYGPIDTTQLNASAQGEGGFQWPLKSDNGTGLSGTGSETMFWDLMNITDVDFAVTNISDKTNATGAAGPTTNSNYYLEFDVTVKFLNPNQQDSFNAFAWNYTGGTAVLCQDEGGTSDGHDCDTSLATINVDGGHGGLISQGASDNQLHGSLTIEGKIDPLSLDDPDLFNPDSSSVLMSANIFTEMGTTDFMASMLPLQSALSLNADGDAPPVGQTVQFLVAVPEPTTLLLLGAGLLGIGVAARRRQ